MELVGVFMHSLHDDDNFDHLPPVMCKIYFTGTACHIIARERQMEIHYYTNISRSEWQNSSVARNEVTQMSSTTELRK
jgi:hypothetical protein